MPSAKNRFEVFKRDKFQCQYCGRTPPQVVLELEHIMPKSRGGKDRVENYLTACFECNRGKGNNLLTDLPQSVTANLEELKEKRLQLHEYNNFLEEQENLENDEIWGLSEVFYEHFQRRFTDIFKTTLKRFVRNLPIGKIREAMELGISRFPDDPENALRYFCGICWNWIKRPETRNW